MERDETRGEDKRGKGKEVEENTGCMKRVRFFILPVASLEHTVVVKCKQQIKI